MVFLFVAVGMGSVMVLFGAVCWITGWHPVDANYCVVLAIILGIFVIGVSAPFLAYKKSRHPVCTATNIRGLLTRWDSTSSLIINESTPLKHERGGIC
jgi:hypothetical protein